MLFLRHPVYFFYVFESFKTILTLNKRLFFLLVKMNNTGNFNNNPPAALMSYPFPMHNPSQHPTLMEQPYINPTPQPFQAHTPHYYQPRPMVDLFHFIFILFFF